ncbi:hypothetical protein [Frondihabitans sp. VKM Ac-2883]|uniref:hypothetical protein n=1 Tax=Frondihabitans sp. VKM Ac-2883 TaxID=2783823 RepID=UPI00188C94AA|nr:hypothetical protein [Frondihabitans sp. VKM Ac-2883]MBF4574754.1 hypothetical protein [Frondihabitans sp. VKM Ac-2883]
MMMSPDRRALILLLSPAVLHLLDLLLTGVTSEKDLTQRTAGRLGIPTSHAREVLENLVRNDFVTRERSGGYRGLDEARFRDELAAARRHLVGLRLAGDHAQADLLERALDSAWDARSADAARKKSARRFIRSEDGRRLDDLMQSQTLGEPFALLRLQKRAG